MKKLLLCVLIFYSLIGVCATPDAILKYVPEELQNLSEGLTSAEAKERFKDKLMTIAQDESTSVVYGMPKEAAAIGAAYIIERLQDIPSVLVKLSKKMTVRKSS